MADVAFSKLIFHLGCWSVYFDELRKI